VCLIELNVHLQCRLIQILKVYCRGTTVKTHKETSMLNEDHESKLKFNRLTAILLKTKLFTLQTL